MATAILNPIPCLICENTTAKFHCNTCGDILCAACKERHLKSNATRDHTVLPYVDKLDPKLIAGLICHKHQGNGAEYWCETCGKHICLSCITNEHQGHKISKMTTKLGEQRDAMVKELKSVRDSAVFEWEDALRNTQELAVNCKDDFDRVDKELVNRAGAFHKRMDEILSKRRKTLNDMRTLQMSRLQSNEKYLADRIRQMKEDVKKYEGYLIRADPNVFIRFKEGDIMKEEKPPNPAVKSPVLIKRQGNEEDFLQEMFGQISEMPDDKPEPESKERLLARKPSAESTFGVDYRYPYVVCSAKAGQAWVRNGDTTIQLMDRGGSVHTTINAKCILWDVALATNGDICITDNANKSIKKVSTNGEISTLFNTKLKPCGLCCLQNDDIIVTFPDEGKVIRYDIIGTIKQRYNRITFRWPYRVACSKVNQDVYVVDSDYEQALAGRFLCIEEDGQIRYEYTGQTKMIFTAVDVCTDRLGHVLIYETQNYRLHVLDQEGHLIQYIQTGRLPRYIDVDKEGYLWVGMWEGQIEVYEYLLEDE